ncbi:ATP-dependent 6-phosphofructokinase [[Empedobacter] haloabium]|uniref:ATP-dependent 6-phosphofructokinase n=1 Tax=[Empedobacter] haloabium TaxID=592317 RepID=A0ABZ1UDR3_9BURK
MALLPRRIGIVTGGGDAPGLNAVIRAVVLSACRLGWECWGIRDSFNGLLAPERCEGEPVLRLLPADVRGIAHLGGTMLGSTSRGNPLHYPVPGPDGQPVMQDRSDDVVRRCRQRGIETLVIAGGDSTMAIAECLQRKGMAVVGVPKTIDNDLAGTWQTFGFDSAVAFATACIDRLHSTADSQHRVLVVEVMGRHAGWIALHAGLAAAAHVVLLPEISFDLDVVVACILGRDAAGACHSVVVVAEGAHPRDGSVGVLAAPRDGHAERLGGIGAWLEQHLAGRTGKECRTVVLGHLLRGGAPSAFDRVIAARFGAAAIRALAAGQSGVMVALQGDAIGTVPLAAVAGHARAVPLGDDTLATARELGICLGER